MSDEVQRPTPSPAKKLGWWLLALALGSPFALAGLEIISVAQAGEFLVYAGFAWLVAAVVIDLVTRKRDAETKAVGRIVAALLSLSVVLFYSFN